MIRSHLHVLIVCSLAFVATASARADLDVFSISLSCGVYEDFESGDEGDSDGWQVSSPSALSTNVPLHASTQQSLADMDFDVELDQNALEIDFSGDLESYIIGDDSEAFSYFSINLALEPTQPIRFTGTGILNYDIPDSPIDLDLGGGLNMQVWRLPDEVQLYMLDSEPASAPGAGTRSLNGDLTLPGNIRYIVSLEAGMSGSGTTDVGLTTTGSPIGSLRIELVPEPATLLLVAAAIPFVARRRRAVV